VPLRRTLLVLIGAGILALATEARAGAPVPACHGRDARAAATARAEGLKHYRVSKREGASDAEMIAALGFFDASCAAGDDTVLELRAYALAGLERYVEAAETLDAFLAAHPLATLPPETRARVAAQRPEMLARVATLSIDSTPQGAEVTVNHRPVGTTPLLHLRLDPGRYDVALRVDGGASAQRTLDLAAGESHESFSLDAAPPSAAASPPAPSPAATAPEEAPATGAFRPYVIGAAAAAGVFLLTGIGGAIWANERSNVYNAASCDGGQKAGCPSTLSQYYAGRDIEVVGFVGAGVAAAAAGTLFYLDRRREQARSKPESLGSVACGLGGAAVSCAGTF
jgi:hypothetical protein